MCIVKVRKPLLSAVLVLALLALALILPATAAAASGKQPVAWVSYGAARHFLDTNGKLVGLNQQAVSVQLCGDGTIRGHATFQMIKSDAGHPRLILMADEDDFLGAGPILGDPRGLGFWFEASFDALVWVPGTSGPTLMPDFLTATCSYIDGPDGDWFLAPGLGPPVWSLIPSPGNITVHIRAD